MKAFSNGCAAMTGVEAVSNRVMAFRDPRAENAQTHADGHHRHSDRDALRYRVAGKEVSDHGDGPGPARYQSLLSLIVMAVFGRGWFFHFTMWSVFLAFCLSANTAFADFPRLTRAIAMNDFLPHVFVMRGRRLLFSYGIYALTAMTAVLLITFGGINHRSSRYTPSARFWPSPSPSLAWSSTGGS